MELANKRWTKTVTASRAVAATAGPTALSLPAPLAQKAAVSALPTVAPERLSPAVPVDEAAITAVSNAEIHELGFAPTLAPSFTA